MASTTLRLRTRVVVLVAASAESECRLLTIKSEQLPRNVEANDTAVTTFK